MIVTESSVHNRGEQKVFVQLLITTVFYGIMSIIVEVMTFIDWQGDADLQLTLIAFLNVFNYLPELSLPLLLVCSSVQVRKRISIFVARSPSATIVTPKATIATAKS
ncbi:unnamed protein product [Caenorhabditis sp. 36 PRJEB53466]|nr:unnamed protein product [Caenorhabditis sp. 36 PRJEB53466]